MLGLFKLTSLRHFAYAPCTHGESSKTAACALAYNAFVYADVSTKSLELAAPSLPYYIGTGVASQAVSGQPGWGLINSSLVA